MNEISIMVSVTAKKYCFSNRYKVIIIFDEIHQLACNKLREEYSKAQRVTADNEVNIKLN